MRTALAAFALSLAASASHAELPVIEGIARLHAGIQAPLASHEYDAVLAQLDEALKSRERLADGRWKLNFLLGGVRRGLAGSASPEEWQRRETDFKALAARHESSPNGWLLAALVPYWHAWSVRGNGMSDTVSPEAQDAYRNGVARAAALLDAHPAHANPAWYDYRLQMATELGEPRAARDRLFAEAIKNEPAYQQTWFSRLNSLEPKWGGNLADAVVFINQAAAVTSPTEGRGLGARLLFAADAEYGGVIDAPTLDWNALRASLVDLVTRYPDESNAQIALWLACSRSDKLAASKFAALVAAPPSGALLRQNAPVLGMCLEWAHGKLASFAMRDRDTGQAKIIK